MGWPKGKPRKMSEQNTDPLVLANARSRKGDAARRDLAEEIVRPVLADVTDKLGVDAAIRGAPALRAWARALVEKGPMPGQKPKPLRGPVVQDAA